MLREAATFTDLLTQIEKPSRYLGDEVNAVRKDLATVALKVALAYPDFYEVGMSNTGLHILYHLLNAQPEIACERAYLPGRDLEAILVERGIPLVTLENKLPLCETDIFGIQLPHELAYTNIVKLIRLARIPLYSAARKDDDPIVLGGGPGAFGPEVVAPFYDAILVGDAEEAVLEVARVVRESKRDRLPRLERLERLADIEGVYVPRFFDVRYKADGRLDAVVPLRAKQPVVRKAIVADLETAFYPDKAIVPYADTVHNRLGIEVMRGCTVGCRFCQAGMIYRPLRERSPKRILDLARCGLSSTGFEDVSLLSLDTGDYTLIEPLTKQLLKETQDRKIALSLPSLRAGSLTDETIREIKRVRKTGFTIAPEAGTQRLRDVINKNISDEEIFETVDRVASQGWDSIKLYFMVGFPTETKADLDGLCELALKVRRLARRHDRDFDVTVSVGTLVPKPHTPFQWDAQISTDESLRRMRYLVDRLRPHHLNVKYWDPKNSWLEGVLSRGDRRLAPVIAAAEEAGCAFDSWTEHYKLDVWKRVFEEHGIDPEFYMRRRAYDEVLPWDHLDARVGKGFLEADRRKVDKAHEPKHAKNVTTFDCRDDLCAGCSTCFEGDIRNRLAKYAPNPFGDGRRLPVHLTGRIAGGHDFGKKLEDAVAGRGKPRDQAAKAGEDAAKAILRRRARPANPSDRRWHTTPGAPGQAGPADAFKPAAITAEALPKTPERAGDDALAHDEDAARREESVRADARAEGSVHEQRGRRHEAGTAAFRYRVGYRRLRGTRFLSHLELVKTVYRAITRAELPVRFTEGFHPKPKIAFGPPLAVGVESEDEELDLYLDAAFETEDLLARLVASFPTKQGLEPFAVRRADNREPSLQVERVGAAYEADLEPIGLLPPSIAAGVAAFQAASSVPFAQDRQGEVRTIDLKASVEGLTLEGTRVRFELRSAAASAAPSGPSPRAAAASPRAANATRSADAGATATAEASATAVSSATARPDELVAALLGVRVEDARRARIRLVRAIRRTAEPAGGARA